MKKKLTRYLAAAGLMFILIMPALMLFMPVYEAGALGESDLWGGKKDETVEALGFSTTEPRDPREIIASVIRVMLGFLGIIAVVIILWGGFKWMTAGGAEDKTTEARKIITAGIIGLLIIIAAYAIASFVMGALITVTE